MGLYTNAQNIEVFINDIGKYLSIYRENVYISFPKQLDKIYDNLKENTNV